MRHKQRRPERRTDRSCCEEDLWDIEAVLMCLVRFRTDRLDQNWFERVPDPAPHMS